MKNSTFCSRSRRVTRVILAPLFLLVGSGPTFAFTPPPAPGSEPAVENEPPVLDDAAEISIDVTAGESFDLLLPAASSRGSDPQGDAFVFALAGADASGSFDTVGGRATLGGSDDAQVLMFSAESTFEGPIALDLVLVETATSPALRSAGTLPVSVMFEAVAIPDPEPVEPDPVEPDPVEPDPVVPDPVEPEAMEPDPEPVEPDPVEPEATSPEPVEPEAMTPDPVESEPVEPEAMTPDPVESDPVEPEAMTPDPVESDPVEPEAMESDPVELEPMESEPVEPDTEEPMAMVPGLVEPEAMEPEPDALEPVEPEELRPELDLPSANASESEVPEENVGEDAKFDAPASPGGDGSGDSEALPAIEEPNAEESTDEALTDEAPAGEAPTDDAQTIGSLAKPAAFRAVLTDERVIIVEWEPVAGAAEYEVSRDGEVLATTGQTVFVDAGVSPGQVHDYSLVALDVSGDVRSPAASLSLEATVEPRVDDMRPIAPGELFARRDADGTVVLAWRPGGDDIAVTGYNVYRDGAYHDTVHARGYRDVDAPTDGPTFYEIVAFDGTPNYSVLSPAVLVEPLGEPDRVVESLDAGPSDVEGGDPVSDGLARIVVDGEGGVILLHGESVVGLFVDVMSPPSVSLDLDGDVPLDLLVPGGTVPGVEVDYRLRLAPAAVASLGSHVRIVIRASSETPGLTVEVAPR